jgi:lipopolysaccharide biosynthesis protein
VALRVREGAVEQHDCELIERSGLFDRAWYFAQQPEVARSGHDPVRDYLRRGAKTGRNPNGIFDGAWYLTRNPDAAGTNPLVHYILHGAAADCDPGPLFDTQWYRTQHPTSETPLARYLKHGWKRGLLPFDPTQRFADTRIAVVVHLFYAELWAEMASWLRNIPIGFDLFVTVPREHAAELRGLVLRDYADAQVLKVPNAGRDVGAFFSVLPKVLAGNYTALCKLHSKKGKEQPEAWRDLLLRGLLANKMLVSRILLALGSDPDLALVGPRDLYLCGETQITHNQHKVEEVFERLCPGQIIPRNWGFFAGTMFWARPAFFRPFLKCDGNLFNFEADNTARDGQLAHAFERVFGALGAMEKKRIGLTEIVGPGAFDGTLNVIKAPGNPWTGSLVRVLSEHTLRLNGEIGWSEKTRPAPPEWANLAKKTVMKLPSPVQSTLRIPYWIGTGQLVPRIRAALAAQRDMKLIAASPLFDREWYLQRYPGVRSAGINPARDYALHGVSGYRDPGPFFDTAWYLAHYPDVAAAGANPLAHYILQGAAEGRQPNPSRIVIGDAIDVALSCRKRPPGSGEIALFVAHAPEGHVKPHVPHYLASLQKRGIHPVVIIASDGEFRADTTLLALAHGLYVRQNVGFDFGAWAHVLRTEPQLLSGADILYLVNDSMLGPLNEQKFDRVLERIRASAADVIGLTDSYEKRWHVQSYFIVLKQRTLASPAFRRFIDGIKNLADKQAVVNAYETRFAPTLETAGLSCEVLFPVTRGYNHSLADWDTLIRSGLAFVKVSALRQRTQKLRPRDWQKLLRSEGFDPRLAEQTLDVACSV